MDDVLNPANLIVLAVIAVGMFFGLRRIAASTHGKSCCSDGTSGKKAKRLLWWIPMRPTTPIAMSCSLAA